jgi:hypothetical protein
MENKIRKCKSVTYVTLQHKTRLKSQILESEILVLCESVLQELSTNTCIFDIIIPIIFDRYGHLNVQNRDKAKFH